MYAGEDGDVCVELGYVGKELPASKSKQPDKSKAGGWPAWFGEAPVDVADLVCRICGRYLYLVTQIYAPTHVQRALCVFGCNHAACSQRPEGWRVIRTQGSPPPADLSGDESNGGAVAAVGDTMPPVPPVSAQASVEPPADAWGASDVSWDAAAADGDGWGAETSEWGAGADTEGVGVGAAVDIGALLDEREKKLSKPQGDQATAAAAEGRSENGRTCGQSAPANPTINGVCGDVHKCEAGDAEGRPSFTARTVSFMPEPWGAESSRSEDKDMQNRLRRYREQEEDRGLVAALDQALGLNDGAGAGSGSQDQQGGGGSIGEKYERTPARAKAVMRFAERVARSPQQVVRYAYEGQPLWSVSDPPKDDVPLCACGAARVFEMQLMPALLLQLRVTGRADREPHDQDPEESPSPLAVDVGRTKAGSSRTTSSAAGQRKEGDAPAVAAPERGDRQRTGGAGGAEGEEEEEGAGGGEGAAAVAGVVAMPEPSAEDRERLRTRGMDWGVVGVWCCPRSCDESCEESVVVQLPV